MQNSTWRDNYVLDSKFLKLLVRKSEAADRRARDGQKLQLLAPRRKCKKCRKTQTMQSDAEVERVRTSKPKQTVAVVQRDTSSFSTTDFVDWLEQTDDEEVEQNENNVVADAAAKCATEEEKLVKMRCPEVKAKQPTVKPKKPLVKPAMIVHTFQLPEKSNEGCRLRAGSARETEQMLNLAMLENAPNSMQQETSPTAVKEHVKEQARCIFDVAGVKAKHGMCKRSGNKRKHSLERGPKHVELAQGHKSAGRRARGGKQLKFNADTLAMNAKKLKIKSRLDDKNVVIDMPPKDTVEPLSNKNIQSAAVEVAPECKTAELSAILIETSKKSNAKSKIKKVETKKTNEPNAKTKKIVKQAVKTLPRTTWRMGQSLEKTGAAKNQLRKRTVNKYITQFPLERKFGVTKLSHRAAHAMKKSKKLTGEAKDSLEYIPKKLLLYLHPKDESYIKQSTKPTEQNTAETQMEKKKRITKVKLPIKNTVTKAKKAETKPLVSTKKAASATSGKVMENQTAVVTSAKIETTMAKEISGTPPKEATPAKAALPPRRKLPAPRKRLYAPKRQTVVLMKETAAYMKKLVTIEEERKEIAAPKQQVVASVKETATTRKKMPAASSTKKSKAKVVGTTNVKSSTRASAQAGTKQIPTVLHEKPTAEQNGVTKSAADRLEAGVTKARAKKTKKTAVKKAAKPPKKTKIDSTAKKDITPRIITCGYSVVGKVLGPNSLELVRRHAKSKHLRGWISVTSRTNIRGVVEGKSEDVHNFTNWLKGEPTGNFRVQTVDISKLKRSRIYKYDDFLIKSVSETKLS